MAETVQATYNRNVCSECGEVFTLKALLKAHLAKHALLKRDEEQARQNTPSLSTSKFFPTSPVLYSASVPIISQDVSASEKSSEVGPSIAESMFSSDDNTSGYETDKTITSSNCNSTPYHCSICEKVFDTHLKFSQHNNSDGHKKRQKAASGNLESADEVKKVISVYKCPVEGCSKNFDNEMKLIQHQTMKHGTVTHADEIDTSSSTNSEFRCETVNCHKVFPTKPQLLQHIRDKHDDKNSSSEYRKLCPHCDDFNRETDSKSFVFLTYIDKHMLTAHEKPGYVKGTCPICSMRIEKQKNLLTHISRAHLFNRFKDEACFICLRLCKDKNDLLQHSTSVHRFKCVIDACHSMFPSKPLRDKHMLDKHRVYACGIENCTRIFSSLEEKMDHMKSPHKGTASESVPSHVLGLGNFHDDGIISEPAISRAPVEYLPSLNVRNSADEHSLRHPTDPSLKTFLSIHRRFRENVEELRHFIETNTVHLSQFTSQECSHETFVSCESLKSLLDAVQRRLTPRID